MNKNNTKKTIEHLSNCSTTEILYPNDPNMSYSENKTKMNEICNALTPYQSAHKCNNGDDYRWFCGRATAPSSSE